MKKRNRIITVFATALFTFGTLWATLGSDHFNKRHRHYHGHHHCDERAQQQSDALE